jgi:hypothetical protein
LNTAEITFKSTRWVLISVAAIFVIPVAAYFGIHEIYTTSPEIVYYQRLNQPNAKWEKIGETDDFAEYVDPDRIIEKNETTFHVMAMRNYFDSQNGAEDLDYYSTILAQEIDCVHRTIKPRRITFFKEKFAKGDYSEGPFAIRSKAFNVSPQSVGSRKIEYVCSSKENKDKQFI